MPGKAYSGVTGVTGAYHSTGEPSFSATNLPQILLRPFILAQKSGHSDCWGKETWKQQAAMQFRAREVGEGEEREEAWRERKQGRYRTDGADPYLHVRPHNVTWKHLILK